MDIDFDNIYLCDELREIDKLRAESDRPPVLPLKHFEKDFYVDPMKKKLRRQEWFNISYNLMYVAFIVGGVSGLFLVDWIYYTGLDVVRRNAMVNFTQSGSFNFTLTVNGTGLLARIIRNATAGLNVTEFLSMNETNAKCLPAPTLTDWTSYVNVYAVAAIIFYINFNLILSQRMMSVICGHFFPRKHQMRVTYLYNQILIRRRIYFEQSMLDLLENESVIGAHNVNEYGSTTPPLEERRWWETLIRCLRDARRRAMEKLGGTAELGEHCIVCLERGKMRGLWQYYSRVQSKFKIPIILNMVPKR